MVTAKIGFYLVTTIDAHGVHTHHVSKDKRCSCGGHTQRPCAHIQAVARYLQQGGERAAVKETQAKLVLHQPKDDVTPPSSTPAASSTLACPLCGATTVPTAYGWRCLASPGHYWRWRGEQNGVKAFLTQAHPAKQGGFYEQTPAERDAFLAQAHRRMFRNGYTPYGG